MSRYAALILALVVLLGGACAHRPPADGAGEQDALQRREREFLAAMGARDLERATAFFADDAVLHVANMPALHGRPAIAQFYGNLFRFLRASDAEPERLHVSRSADLAYSTGRVSNVFEGPQGRSEYAGKYLLVWERRAGEWAVVLYGVSNDRAEAPR